MACLSQESRGLIATEEEAREDSEPSSLPAQVPFEVRCQGRKLWILGVITFGLFALLGVGGATHRHTSANLRAIASEWEAGVPVIANVEVQEMIDGLKDRVPGLLKMQGWNTNLGSFKALTFCKQAVNGESYVVKVDVTDDQASQVASAGNVLQMIVYKPKGYFPVFSISMVARNDQNCFATPLTPTPSAPTEVFNATPQVQAMCDAVKGNVPALLKKSGWKLNLAPYTALKYCGDDTSKTVMVKIADTEALLTDHPSGFFLRLKLRMNGQSASLEDAVMVSPVNKTCNSVPVLPVQGSRTVR